MFLRIDVSGGLSALLKVLVQHVDDLVRHVADFYVSRLSPRTTVVVFAIVYTAAMIFFQLHSKIPPWRENAPIDLLNGCLLWMLSIVALIMASLTRHAPQKSLMWLLGSSVLGLVALDEIFGIHEAARHVIDDDDPKIFMALVAAIALLILVKVEKIRGTPLRLLVAGYAVQFAYLMSDLGDGDFFDIRFGHRDVLRIVEEGLEFSAMSMYFIAFMFILFDKLHEGHGPS